MRLDALLAIGTDLELAATVRHIVDAAAELTGSRSAVLETGPCDAPVLHVPVEGYGRLHLAGGRPSPALDVLAARAGAALAGARLYEAARQRERWIEGAAAVTTALLGNAGSADPLMTVADRARLLADAAAGVVLQPTAEGGMEIVAASTYDDPGDIVGTTIRPGSAVLVQLLGGEPVFIDDSATDPRMTTHVRHRFGPSMMLPLQADGRLIGTLALPRRHAGRPYTETEKHLAVQFASQAAVALLLADARHRRERLAVYEDRDRIARDLHDLVIQRLFATGMMLQATGRRAASTALRETGAGEDHAGKPRAAEARAGDQRAGKPRAAEARADDQRAEEPRAAETQAGDRRIGKPPTAQARAADARARHAIDTAVTELEATVQQIRTAIFRLQQPPAEPPSGLRARLLREAAAALGTQPSVRFTGPVDALVPDHLVPTLLGALREALAELTDADIEVFANGRKGVRLTVNGRTAWEAAVE
ncbi:GAF domain-containing protein [Streptomyces niveiscabiei]|uniref:GAF domain-containing protein n=1 Tax=Streptomyces niveiscabiei TaxID=164115 RepID=UPI0029A4DB52|nr:GAF domain-containing protein [Streptomyces niveiscabiei]MDX3384045.1 GAF domain-containing protein [Streptomyces niveiscabiei]